MSTSPTERFAELYDSCHAPLVAYARRRVGGDAVHDLVADVFLAAWRRIDDAPDGERALAWLLRIAYHATGNHWRGRDRRLRLVKKLGSARSGPSTTSSPHDLDTGPAVEQVILAAENLSDDDYELLRLAHWDELPLADIAIVLDVSANTAKQRLRRARRKLQAEYERTSNLVSAEERSSTEGDGS